MTKLEDRFSQLRADIEELSIEKDERSIEYDKAIEINKFARQIQTNSTAKNK